MGKKILYSLDQLLASGGDNCDGIPVTKCNNVNDTMLQGNGL